MKKRLLLVIDGTFPAFALHIQCMSTTNVTAPLVVVHTLQRLTSPAIPDQGRGALFVLIGF